MVAGLRQSGGSGRALGEAAPGGWPRSRWWPGEEATMWKWSGGSGGGVCDKEATPLRENDLVGAM
jgi:hypothetical protein